MMRIGPRVPTFKYCEGGGGMLLVFSVRIHRISFFVTFLLLRLSRLVTGTIDSDGLLVAFCISLHLY